MRRLDLLFIDLDNTLWKGIWGESSTSSIEKYKLHLINDLKRRGISLVILTNIEKPENVKRALKIHNIRESDFVGIICSDGPKIRSAEKILEKISIPWARVGIVDDDPIIRKDFKRKGSLVFAGFHILKNFNWDLNHPYLNKESIESRFRIRRIGIEITNFSSDENKYLFEYLNRIRFRIYIELQSDFNNIRIAELFNRTNQMHFNRKYFYGNRNLKGISNKINKYLDRGNKIGTVTVQIGKNSMGVQGAFLYRFQNNRVIVDNATFSCSIIPFKVVEKLSIQKIVNSYLNEYREVVFNTNIVENNRRVNWLLSDLKATKKQNSYSFKKQIKLDSKLSVFSLCKKITRKEDDGVPPITTFYDSYVNRLFMKYKLSNILDIGYGFGEILGKKRNLSIKRISIFNNSTLLRGDIIPRENDILNIDIQSMNSIDDDSIDLEICLEVLEHVDDPALAFYEILRVLKNNGYLFFSVPGESYPYHPFSNDKTRFSSIFLNNIFKCYGNIKNIYVQKYGKNEIRTILLFQKRSILRLNKIFKIFKNHKNNILLPMNISYYD